ncbi:MAG: hypothetical protein U5K37_12085 [Natrialbaceae archaeon]|nr:hypothetical protein [Natrialbaceae archaeon]
MDSQPDWQRIAIRGFSAIVLAVLANVVLLTIVLEADLVIPFDPLRYPPVVFLTTMGTLGATVV